MNTRLIVAALLGSVVAFFLGWLVYGILLAPYYEVNSELVIHPGRDTYSLLVD